MKSLLGWRARRVQTIEINDARRSVRSFNQFAFIKRVSLASPSLLGVCIAMLLSASPLVWATTAEITEQSGAALQSDTSYPSDTAGAATEPTKKAIKTRVAAEPTQWDTPAFAEALHQSMLLAVSQSVAAASNINALHSQVLRDLTAKPSAALVALYQQRGLIVANSQSGKSAELIEAGLQLHAERWALALLDDFMREMNDFGAAKVRYELARYYSRTGRWADAARQLSDAWILEQLPRAQADRAELVHATALQKLKRHRDAIKIYEAVGADSAVYAEVQLNLATAYLRQEWWTDAQLAIEKSLKANSNKSGRLADRAYTTLGYAQIQHGFYRDARASFRPIGLESPYLLKAAFGLGLAALNQKDFAGALAIFDRLRARADLDMSVSEAHLLYAFTLRQMQQVEAAKAAYESAINYYENLIAPRKTMTDGAVQLPLLRASSRADYGLCALNERRVLLEQLMHDYPALAPRLAPQLAQLNQSQSQRYLYWLNADVRHLESYLSQSQFGLASLYD